MGIKGKASSNSYLIDFGLSKRYYDQIRNIHIPYRKDKNIIGTARFCSIHSHLGEELSRRDDLEALSYIMIYFYTGSLPWQSLQTKAKKEKFSKIKVIKISTSPKDLCKGCPPEMREFVEYCRDLKFDEEPKYEMLKELLEKIGDKEGYDITEPLFDWEEGDFNSICDYQNRQVYVSPQADMAVAYVEDAKKKRSYKHMLDKLEEEEEFSPIQKSKVEFGKSMVLPG